jgi:hypothetical protein
VTASDETAADTPAPAEVTSDETTPTEAAPTDPVAAEETAPANDAAAENPAPAVEAAPADEAAAETSSPGEAVTPVPGTPEPAPSLPARSTGRKIDPAVIDGLTAAIDEFVNVDDGREPFRKMWIARRLAQKNVLLDRAELLASQALEAASQATEAERSIRDMPSLDRDARLAVFTARGEDTLGLVLLKRGSLEDAIAHLSRGAAGPSNDPDHRSRLWHLGLATQESGKHKEALDLYIRAYDPAAPTAPVRKSVIEQLYRKVNNGSLAGLDEKLKGN